MVVRDRDSDGVIVIVVVIVVVIVIDVLPVVVAVAVVVAVVVSAPKGSSPNFETLTPVIPQEIGLERPRQLGGHGQRLIFVDAPCLGAVF